MRPVVGIDCYPTRTVTPPVLISLSRARNAGLQESPRQTARCHERSQSGSLQWRKRIRVSGTNPIVSLVCRISSFLTLRQNKTSGNISVKSSANINMRRYDAYNVRRVSFSYDSRPHHFNRASMHTRLCMYCVALGGRYQHGDCAPSYQDEESISNSCTKA